jgi:hypothetical protein
LTYRRSPRRTAPIDYTLPKTLAVTQLFYQFGYPWQQFTTYELFTELTAHNIRAVKLWLDINPFDGMESWCWESPAGQQCFEGGLTEENMRDVWAYPDIDVIVLRLQNPRWTTYARDYKGTAVPNTVIADAPYYEIATQLYKFFGWRDLVIIFTDWEQDWLLVNSSWNRATLEERQKQLLGLLEKRQQAIERARREAFAKYGRTPLRIFHAAIVNRYPGNEHPGEEDIPRLATLIPTLEHPPDFIGLSYWKRKLDPIPILNWLSETTGYPPERIYIDEFGEREDLQYDRLMDYVPVFWNWGIRLVCIWNWRQTYCYPDNNRGLWEQIDCTPGEPVEWGNPTEGYDALRELQGLLTNSAEDDSFIESREKRYPRKK